MCQLVFDPRFPRSPPHLLALLLPRRFVPNLQFAMEDIVEGRLDEDAFPFVPGTASSSTAATRGSSRADAGRSQRTFGLNSRWAKKRKDTGTRTDGLGVPCVSVVPCWSALPCLLTQRVLSASC